MVIYNFKHSWRSFVVLCLNLFFSEMSEYEHVEVFFYNLFSSTANELCQGEASVFHQSAIHTIHRLFYSKHVSNAVKPAHIDH